MNRQEEKKMFDSIKMRLMCGVTAVAVTAGSFACPVNVWADDDDDDILLEDLLDLTDEEVIILSALADRDGDGDVDEAEVSAISTALTVSALAEADRRYEAEEQARKQAEAAAQAALAAQRSAEQAARDAQKKLEEERQKKNSKVSGIWVSSTDVTLTPGQTYQVIAGVKPDTARNKGVHFYTSNWNVASIDGSGIIRGNSVGSCYITAVSDDGGYQARTCVRVNPAPAVAAQTIAQDANWTAISANLILAAAPGATVNLVAPKAMSFDAGMINALRMRPDVGLLIAYPYNGHTYAMAVPAGYNLSAKTDKNGKVSFLALAGVKDGKILTSMVQ